MEIRIKRIGRDDLVVEAPSLRQANLIGSDLRGADLHGAYLRGADLSEADLTGATTIVAKYVPTSR